MADNLQYLQDYTIEILQYEYAKEKFDQHKAYYYVEHLITPVIESISNKILPYTSNHRIKRSPMQVELVFDTPVVSDNIFSVAVNYEMTEIVFYLHSPSLHIETKTLSIEDPNVFNEQDIWLEFARMLTDRKKGLDQNFLPSDEK
ncbi:hypothetical protein [Moraxella catarrhalis]|jgi:hypothetical protein|nr:hypothetical protein [Moraxella catarrhalis]ARE67008.1 hypothetical protein MC195_09540 [Moraxella catarrhalis]MPW68396.1 hypothetical protein [Moraxella catarrhalis]MPX27840.1 hypothetical protein [Moraxella catarrhalis]MPX57052.1 hypothetical protein [Moraxella catarrhalis]MPX68911.1 hypothetical protein [Moraxella catarrhalis]